MFYYIFNSKPYLFKATCSVILVYAVQLRFFNKKNPTQLKVKTRAGFNHVSFCTPRLHLQIAGACLPMLERFVTWLCLHIWSDAVCIILAKLACPLSDIMFCLHSGITNLSLYKHCLLLLRVSSWHYSCLMHLRVSSCHYSCSMPLRVSSWPYS